MWNYFKQLKNTARKRSQFRLKSCNWGYQFASLRSWCPQIFLRSWNPWSLIAWPISAIFHTLRFMPYFPPARWRLWGDFIKGQHHKFHKRSHRTEVAEVLEFHQKELKLVILDQNFKMYSTGLEMDQRPTGLKVDQTNMKVVTNGICVKHLVASGKLFKK